MWNESAKNDTDISNTKSYQQKHLGLRCSYKNIFNGPIARTFSLANGNKHSC